LPNMNDSMNKKIIAFNGSPVKDGNTDLITREVLRGAEESGFTSEHVYLNDLTITACQSCGESPGGKLCLFEDDLFPYLHKFASSDIVVVASPIYFDTISAQTKLFIDRCNCFKPLECYESGDYKFTNLELKSRLGIIVLVGGEREKFDHTLPIIRGFFIWTGVILENQILYSHSDFRAGGVKDNQDSLKNAYSIGRQAALKSFKK
jgi:multimeric flavodoxin WrbA